MSAAPAGFAWLLVSAQLVIFGTAAFSLLMRAMPAAARPAVRRRLAAIWRWLALMLLVVSPFAFLDIARTMAQTAWWRAVPLVPEILRETDAGHAWAIRFVVVVMLAVATWLRLPARASASLMLVLAGALMLLSAITSHAIDFGRFSIAVYFAHEAGAGFWIGALGGLLLGCLDESSRVEWIKSATPMVAWIALLSVVLLAATGVFNAHLQLDWSPRLMIDTIYGRTLSWKLATFALVVAFAAHSRLRLLRRLDQTDARESLTRNVTAELILLAIVLGWSAILANTPPPH